MTSMADHNNNNNKRNNNINSRNTRNYSSGRGNVNSDTKKLIKSSTIKPTSSSDVVGNAGGSENRSERCVLCLDEKRSPVCIACGHSFCNECLDVYKSYQIYAWAKRCPICRVSLKEKRRYVKRKHSEDNIDTRTTTTRRRIMTASDGGPSRLRLSAAAATVTTETATTAVGATAATTTATAPIEANADAATEQIYLLEEFMAIASDTDVFGLSSDMTFGNTSSVSTPTNSASTVSASEADEEDIEVAEFEGVVDVDARFEDSDFSLNLGVEEDDEESLEEFEGEALDVDYYDTVDEEDPEDDDEDVSNEQLQDAEYYVVESESDNDVQLMDEVIIID